MISKDDVKKLASLSRIAVSEEELEQVSKEIDSILSYVGEIKNAVLSNKEVSPKYSLVNVFREDVVLNETSSNTETLLNSAPDREGDYVKVKKVL
jgi:aspartyl-tRNA(Asn)/glutamyl-tRNA(Gln) amidotransferase subunit C